MGRRRRWDWRKKTCSISSTFTPGRGAPPTDRKAQVQVRPDIDKKKEEHRANAAGRLLMGKLVPRGNGACPAPAVGASQSPVWGGFRLTSPSERGGSEDLRARN